MARFRLIAVAFVPLAVLLAAHHLSAKGGKEGGGGHKGGGGGHKAAPHRAAPKIRPAHRAAAKPNRVNRKPAPHHADHPQAHKQAAHSGKPKGPVKVAKPEDKHNEPPKHDGGKKQSGKKEPAKPTNKPKTPPKRPEVKPKQPNQTKRPDDKAKNLAKKQLEDRHRTRDLHFVGRRHAAVHHFAHYDHNHHRYWFDRHWWWNFIDYPASCDDGQDVPGDYCADGDPGSWVNYEAAVPPANAQTQPPPAIAEGQGLPISRTGAVLAERLDGMDVENHWLPGQDVSWKTGNAVDDNPGGASNGCEFVAAVCARMKVVMADPEPDYFFPDSQFDWLVNEGTGSGWVVVGGNVEAQLLANQGWVVVAAWKSPTPAGDRSLDGEMAIVHPDSKPVEAVANRGPTITVAGQQNHANIALKDSFPQPAWDQVIYMACRPRW